MVVPAKCLFFAYIPPQISSLLPLRFLLRKEGADSVAVDLANNLVRSRNLSEEEELIADTLCSDFGRTKSEALEALRILRSVSVVTKVKEKKVISFQLIRRKKVYNTTNSIYV